MAMLDIIVKAETEGLDTEEEVVEYAIAIIDSKLYMSAGHFGRFLASLQETPLWEQVEAHYDGQAPAYRVEAAVLSNEELYHQDGGEPIVYAVMNENNEVVHVALTEAEAHAWVQGAEQS